jgi:hypothetical protein
LRERIVYGEDGQLLTGTFMDYAIPRADGMPELVIDRTVTPSPRSTGHEGRWRRQRLRRAAGDRERGRRCASPRSASVTPTSR